MAKVLLIEDNEDLTTMIADWLGHEHYQVEVAHTGNDGMDKLRHYAYDLIILDWDLPQMSGLEICKAFRATGKPTPILMLTGKGDVVDREAGLDAGADDYLPKPFHMRELSARLRALLRRPSGMVDNVLKVRDIELNPRTFVVTKGGDTLNLLPLEFALLEFLMRHQGQVFTPEAILDRVWKSQSDSSPEALRTCMMRLRRKLGSTKDDSVIRTVHGVGYKLQP